MPESFDGRPPFEILPPHTDAGDAAVPQPIRIRSVEEIARQPWNELSIETFEQLFPNEDSMGRKLFPSGQLLGRKRTQAALEGAMTRSLGDIDAIKTNTHLIGTLYKQDIRTIRDFFAWEVTNSQFDELGERQPKLIQAVPEAFAQELLPLPHAELLQAVFRIPWSEGAPVVPRDRLEQEDKMRIVVEEEVMKLVRGKKQNEAIILILRYGLYSGKPALLQEVGKQVNMTRERVRQIEEKGVRMLRHPSSLNRLKEFVLSET